MANLTNIIGGQPYYDATATNSESLLNFWKGDHKFSMML